MPDEIYHTDKRERFRKTALMLMRTNANFSFDANAQDFFYAMMHEAERFFREAFNFDSKTHGRREARIHDWLVRGHTNPANRMIRKSTYHRNPSSYGVVLPVFDTRTRYYYMTLKELRADLVYGETNIGLERHASQHDVKWARRLYLNFCRALSGHESNLRRNGLI